MKLSHFVLGGVALTCLGLTQVDASEGVSIQTHYKKLNSSSSELTIIANLDNPIEHGKMELKPIPGLRIGQIKSTSMTDQQWTYQVVLSKSDQAALIKTGIDTHQLIWTILPLASMGGYLILRHKKTGIRLGAFLLAGVLSISLIPSSSVQASDQELSFTSEVKVGEETFMIEGIFTYDLKVVKPVDYDRFEEIHLSVNSTQEELMKALPKEVMVHYSDGTTKKVAVSDWTGVNLNQPGRYQAITVIDGLSISVPVCVEANSLSITSIEEIPPITVEQGKTYDLPDTITLHLSDDTTRQVAVTWNRIETNEVGDYVIEGHYDKLEDANNHLPISVQLHVTPSAHQEVHIVSVEGLNPIEYWLGENQENYLPKIVVAHLSDGSQVEIQIHHWEGIKDEPGQYSATAVYDRPTQVKEDYVISLPVQVKERQIISSEAISSIQVAYGSPKSAWFDQLPTSLNLTLSDRSQERVEITNWKGEVNTWKAGDYTLRGEYSLPKGVRTTYEITAVVQVLDQVARPKVISDKDSYYYGDNPILTIQNIDHIDSIKVIQQKETSDKLLVKDKHYSWDGERKELTILTDAIYRRSLQNFSSNGEQLMLSLEIDGVTIDKTIQYLPYQSLYFTESEVNAQSDQPLKLAYISDAHLSKEKVMLLAADQAITDYQLIEEQGNTYLVLDPSVLQAYLHDGSVKLTLRQLDHRAKDASVNIHFVQAQLKPFTAETLEAFDSYGDSYGQQDGLYAYPYTNSKAVRILVTGIDKASLDQLKQNAKINITMQCQGREPVTFNHSSIYGEQDWYTVEKGGQVYIYITGHVKGDRAGFRKGENVVTLTIQPDGFQQAVTQFALVAA